MSKALFEKLITIGFFAFLAISFAIEYPRQANPDPSCYRILCKMPGIYR